jgi:large subunit ribosomal protein L9
MKLILTQDLANLGVPGDVVEVKSGYGRNYLVPQGIAIQWSKGAENQISSIKRAREVRHIRDLDHAKEIKAVLEALSLQFVARAGDAGQLFGRVTTKELAQSIKKAGGPDVEKQRISVVEPIKHVGKHTVSVSLHNDVVANLTLTVTAAE